MVIVKVATRIYFIPCLARLTAWLRKNYSYTLNNVEQPLNEPYSTGIHLTST